MIGSLQSLFLPRREPRVLLALTGLAVVLSGIGAYDRMTWFLEVLPILIAAPLFVAMWRRFPLTPLLCRLLFLHALILVVGGHYTYARVPLGFWVQDWLHLARNPYDRLGHFAQGFVPAILVREVLLRCSPLRPGKWIAFLTVSVCLAFSALFEIWEFATAMALGQGANDYLGTQGDPWDTQWDMLMCLSGAIVSVLTLSRLHDRQLGLR